MALLKLSGIVTKISGKLNGSILGTGSNGSYIKSNSYSQQPATTLQRAQRNKIYASSQIWRNLTLAQKASFESEVINYPYLNNVGDTVYYTAYQLFNKLNQSRLIIGQPVLLTAPVFTAVTNLTLLSMTVNNGQMFVNFSGGQPNTTTILQATKGLDNSNKPRETDFLQFRITTAMTGGGTLVLLTAYSDFFGIPNPGKYVWFRTRNVVTATGNNTNFTNLVSAIAT